MEININQKKISIGDKYKIFIDGQETHAASQKLWKLLPEIVITGGKRPITINKRLSWAKAKYDITIGDDQVCEFRTKSFWKRHYECECGSNTYDIYGHRGRKYSVYKNNKQVAWWSKKGVTWFAGDNYKIIADKDCDVDLIISFCLVIDNYSSDDQGDKGLTINVGNIGPQAKKFDEGWMPKYS